jgi:hypothetical protein
MIKPFFLHFGDGWKVWDMASQAGLNDQEFYELVDAFEAIDVWRDIYEPQFGALKELEHRSGKDDQGDVLAKFEKGEFVVEHTMIEPGHVMHADKILRADERERTRKGVKLNRCINVPAVSRKLRGKEEITKSLYAINPEWENVDDAILTHFDLVCAAVKKKLIKHSQGGLLVFGTKKTGRSVLHCRDSRGDESDRGCA